MVSDFLTFIITSIIFLIIIGAILAPFESLGRWAGRFGQRVTRSASSLKIGPSKIIFFVEGIDKYDHNPEESKKYFLKMLREHYPDRHIIDSFFPYSVVNKPLHVKRLFAWLRRRLHESKRANNFMLSYIINLRNLYHVAISADSRYGPLHNYGVAQYIIQMLERHGFDDTRSNSKLVFVTTSGGSQMTVGAIDSLSASIQCPIDIVAIGGVISADRSLLTVNKLYNIYGSNDRIYTLGNMLFPGRRFFTRRSYRKEALKRNIISSYCLQGVAHTGNSGYFSKKNADKVLQLIAEKNFIS